MEEQRKKLQEISSKIESYCGLICSECEFLHSGVCGGCVASGGKPFHGECELADCANEKKRRFCGECGEFVCEKLKRYCFDAEHGDNGARLEHCQSVKLALVSAAREGLDPIAYCGFNCEQCPYTKWCGGCRSEYNACSYATLFEDGRCPNVVCAEEKALYGCFDCSDLADCERGFYSIKTEFAAKAAALFIHKYGKEQSAKALMRAMKRGVSLSDAKSVSEALYMLESGLEK